MKRMIILMIGATTLCQGMEKIWHDDLDCLVHRVLKKQRLLMDLEREKIENEQKRAIEEEEKRVVILHTIKEREQAFQRPFGSFENTRRAAAVVIFMQLAAAPLLKPIIEPSNLIKAPQESFNFESNEQKLAILSIKRAPVFQHSKFLPKHEKRYSKKKSHHIQQPQKRR